MFQLPQNVTNLLDLLHSATPQAYLVGGCVRDMFLDIEPHDYDICTVLPPKDIINVLVDKYPVYPKGIEFGTVVAVIDGEEYEVTTYRGESSYSDGRHPDGVYFVSTLDEDLSRRDFTINAMVYDNTHDVVIDPFNGYNDLKEGILRAVGDPDKRFKEDGLRILRAIRFAIRFGLTIEPNTADAMLRNKEMLKYVSKERITDEFRKLFSYNKPIMSTFIQFAPIIAEIIPEIAPCIGMEHDNPYHKHNIYEHCLAVTDLCNTDSFSIKMAALLHDIGKPDTKMFNEEKGYYSYHGHPEISAFIAENVLENDFCCTNKEKEKILTLVTYHDTQIEATATSVKRWLNRIGVEYLTDWTILKTADRDDHNFPLGTNVKWYQHTEDILALIDEITKEKEPFSIKDLAINGKDLIAMGMKPGPEFSFYLSECLEAVISETVPNEKELLIAYINDLQQEIGDQDMDPGN